MGVRINLKIQLVVCEDMHCGLAEMWKKLNTLFSKLVKANVAEPYCFLLCNLNPCRYVDTHRHVRAIGENVIFATQAQRKKPSKISDPH